MCIETKTKNTTKLVKLWKHENGRDKNISTIHDQKKLVIVFEKRALNLKDPVSDYLVISFLIQQKISFHGL